MGFTNLQQKQSLSKHSPFIQMDLHFHKAVGPGAALTTISCEVRIASKGTLGRTPTATALCCPHPANGSHATDPTDTREPCSPAAEPSGKPQE